MTGIQIVQYIISILVSGFVEFGQGIGQGISSIVKAVFLETTGTGADATTTVSVFGTLVIVFAAISICVGLTRLIVGWISSLGGRNVQ